ncbi:FMN reductase [Egicoccus sp. AB-alg2]|uniref:FMN reductase n=1 Tax=Egicoccus sp. AB-alg2 TaxID=3242693 RepID=UPI00359DF753
MTTRTLAVVTAGLSQPSSTRLLADRLAAATVAAVRRGGDDVVVEIVEVRELAHDLTNHLLTGFASGPLQAAKDTVAGADGVIAVTPIFSASYSGLFKSFFDVLEPDALTGTPVLIAATAGTARHSLALEHALRPLFAYLKALVVPTAVFAASEDWGAGGEVDGGLTARIERAADQLAQLLAGAPVHESAARRADPFDEVVPFEQLLRGS